jgi:hypothetical protein
MIREADVDRSAATMNQRILIDSNRIGSVALWMGCEGLTLRRFVSALSLQTLHYEILTLQKYGSRFQKLHPGLPRVTQLS